MHIDWLPRGVAIGRKQVLMDTNIEKIKPSKLALHVLFRMLSINSDSVIPCHFTIDSTSYLFTPRSAISPKNGNQIRLLLNGYLPKYLKTGKTAKSWSNRRT